MEPSPMPYNLRSRGRVVGSRFLRLRRQVQVDDSSSKIYHRRSRRPKPDNPFPGPIVPEDSLSEDEEEGDPKSSEESEDEESMNERRLSFLKDTFPFPFKAMRHYNKNLKEEEQYEVSEVWGSTTTYYDKVGFFHLLHFVGEPRSSENLPSSSIDVPIKHFYARVHEPSNSKTHVSDCLTFLEPPEPDAFIAKVIPVACQVCGLKNAAAIKKRSMTLRREAEARKLETGQSDPESDYDDGFSDQDSRKFKPGEHRCFNPLR